MECLVEHSFPLDVRFKIILITLQFLIVQLPGDDGKTYNDGYLLLSSQTPTSPIIHNPHRMYVFNLSQ